jgi:hypothetical protein
MADAIDEMYEAHVVTAEGVGVSLYRCTNGYEQKPRLALSGFVEHRCVHCKQIIEMQTLLDYRKLRGHASELVTVTW